MKTTPLWSLLVLLMAFSNLNGQKQYPKNYFSSPLEVPLFLSGTFGELRTNHFHSGIDIKTQQKEGLNVLAAAKGAVVRIKVSPYGFGKALYVRHPNGYTTVYAHLQKFSDAIEEYVRSEQYRRESFAIELFPDASKFVFEKGEVIAYSGNTGGSGGPHLHFEIRDTRTEKIINPLLFGFDVKDTRPPDFYELRSYEYDGPHLVRDQEFALTRISQGVYKLKNNRVLEFAHPVAFGLRTYDRQDGTTNKNGVYNIVMRVGGKVFYDFRMETFAFGETRFINSHIDFAQKDCCRRTINKLHVEPNNELSVYGKNSDGVLRMVKDSIYQVEIEVSDIHGNKSVLDLKMKSKGDGTPKGHVLETGSSVFRYGQTNFYKSENFELVLPEKALYKDAIFTYSESEACSKCLSPVFEVGSSRIPVHKYYTMKINAKDVKVKDPSKLCIVSLENGRIDDYEGGTYSNGYVTTRTRMFGSFALAIDSVPPKITAVNFKNGSNVRKLGGLKIKIGDALSGIEHYSVRLDGRWILFEYDAKRSLLYAPMEEIAAGSGRHILEVRVVDDRKNEGIRKYDLIF